MFTSTKTARSILPLLPASASRQNLRSEGAGGRTSPPAGNKRDPEPATARRHRVPPPAQGGLTAANPEGSAATAPGGNREQGPGGHSPREGRAAAAAEVPAPARGRRTHQLPEPTMQTLRGAAESAMAAPPAPATAAAAKSSESARPRSRLPVRASPALPPPLRRDGNCSSAPRPPALRGTRGLPWRTRVNGALGRSRQSRGHCAISQNHRII